MGFEKTISEYRGTKQQLAEGSVEDQEFIRAMALQKAWADRICEIPVGLNEVEREDLAVDITNELGEWLRKQVMEFPVTEDGINRKQYYLQLFDQNPHQAVEELYQLYRQGLH